MSPAVSSPWRPRASRVRRRTSSAAIRISQAICTPPKNMADAPNAATRSSNAGKPGNARPTDSHEMMPAHGPAPPDVAGCPAQRGTDPIDRIPFENRQEVQRRPCHRPRTRGGTRLQRTQTVTAADYACPIAIEAGRLNDGGNARLSRSHETGENDVSRRA